MVARALRTGSRDRELCGLSGSLLKNISDITLRSEDRAAIAEAICILREGFPVEKVVLFGSKARGNDQKDSDIDLLVMTTGALSWQERNAITDALFDTQLRYNVMISTLVVSCEEWEHGLYQALPIRKEVDRDGVLV